MAFDILKPNAALNVPRVFVGGASLDHEVADGDFAAKLSESVDRMRQQSGRQELTANSTPGLNAPLAPDVPPPKTAKHSPPDASQAMEPSATRAPSRQPERANASLGHPRSLPAAGSTPEALVGVPDDEGVQPPAPTIEGIVVSIDAAALDKDKGGVAARPVDRADDPASAMLALLADHRFAPTTPGAHFSHTPMPSRISAASTRSSSDASLMAGDMGQAPPANSEALPAPLNFVQALAAPAHGGQPLLPDMAGGLSSGAAMPLPTSITPATPLAPELPSLSSSMVLSMSTPRDFATSTTSFATRALQDGTTQAVLRVSPDALGPVEARVQLTRQPDGSSLLSMTLTMSNEQALETARQSIADLQHALSAAGLPPVNLTLRLEAPVPPAQSNGSSQSALYSGQQFDDSNGNSRQHNGRHAQNGGERRSGDQPAATAWTPTRLFDKSA